MTTPTANSILQHLDEDQVAAVTHPGSKLCLIAGAGSGKTRTLAARMAYSHVSGERPLQRSLALTFTRDAARQLGERVAQSLNTSKQDLGSLTTGTFHAVAKAQLSLWWAANSKRAPSIAPDRMAFLKRNVFPVIAGISRDDNEAGKLKAEIDWMCARGIMADDYENAAVASGRSLRFNPELVARVASEYQSQKKRRSVIDFDDLLNELRAAMYESDRFLRSQQWLFQHIYVDELQDLNPIQADLLKLWLGDKPDFFFVGDPKQAIYSFNGADPTFITTLEAQFPGTEYVYAHSNYRSSPEILHVAGVSRLHSKTTPGPMPKIMGFETWENETTWVAREIAGLIHDHIRPGQVAVLARTNRIASKFSDRLESLGIPSTPSGGENGLSQVPVLTFHRAKGLEFRAVYVVGAIEGIIPFQDVGDSREAFDEEERLFYVALTRAKELLTITWNGEGGSARSNYLDFVEKSIRQLTEERALQGIVMPNSDGLTRNPSGTPDHKAMIEQARQALRRSNRS